MEDNKISIDKPHEFVQVRTELKENSSGVYEEYKCKKCGLKGKRYGTWLQRPRKEPLLVMDNFLTIASEKKRSKIENCTGIGKFKQLPLMVRLTSEVPVRGHKELKKNGVYLTAETPKHAYDSSVWIQGPKGLVRLNVSECVSYEIKRKT